MYEPENQTELIKATDLGEETQLASVAISLSSRGLCRVAAAHQRFQRRVGLHSENRKGKERKGKEKKERDDRSEQKKQKQGEHRRQMKKNRNVAKRDTSRGDRPQDRKDMRNTEEKRSTVCA